MTENILNLTNKNFKETIDQNEKTVMVDFWAPWCGPCRQIAPELEEASKQIDGSALIAKVNVDENPELAEQYGVQSIPNILVFKGGKPVRQLIGFQTKKTLIEALS